MLEITQDQLWKPTARGIPSPPRPPIPRYSGPDHNLKIPSPQLRFTSPAKAAPSESSNWDFTGDEPTCGPQSPRDTICWVTWCISRCYCPSPLDFCDRRIVRAPPSESPCHLHGFLASTIRWSDQTNVPLGCPWATILSRQWGARQAEEMEAAQHLKPIIPPAHSEGDLQGK